MRPSADKAYDPLSILQPLDAYIGHIIHAVDRLSGGCYDDPFAVDTVCEVLVSVLGHFFVIVGFDCGGLLSADACGLGLWSDE